MIATQIAGWTQDMWQAIIGLFSFIPNWGWMIIVFTIALKIVLIPLDYWQKKMARTNARKQAVLQPELMKLQKKFGNNRQLLNQKTMELYKRENFSMVGSCVGMLVNMALTLFIFFTLFSGLMGMSNAKVSEQYNTLKQEYNTQFAAEFSISGTEEEIAAGIKAQEDLIWNQAIEDTKTEEAEAYDQVVEGLKTEKAEIWEAALAEAQAELGPEAETSEVLALAKEKFLAVPEISELAMEKFTIKKYDAIIQKFAADTGIINVQAKVLEKYNKEVQESFLWVKNVWRPDTNTSVFADYKTYLTLSNFYNSAEYKEELAARCEGKTDEEKKIITEELQQEYQNKYNFVTFSIQDDYKGTWNGYFILVVLAALITYLSVVIAQMQSSKRKTKEQKEMEKAMPQAGGAMKIMKFLLPILMVVFTIGYSSVFALYIVTNSVMSTLLSFLFLKYFEHKEKKDNITISPRPSNRPDYAR